MIIHGGWESGRCGCVGLDGRRAGSEQVCDAWAWIVDGQGWAGGETDEVEMQNGGQRRKEKRFCRRRRFGFVSVRCLPHVRSRRPLDKS